MKVSVVYDIKYGNTKLVAEKIMEGMREVVGIEIATETLHTKETSSWLFRKLDAIRISAVTPTRIGRQIREKSAELVHSLNI